MYLVTQFSKQPYGAGRHVAHVGTVAVIPDMSNVREGWICWRHSFRGFDRILRPHCASADGVVVVFWHVLRDLLIS